MRTPCMTAPALLVNRRRTEPGSATKSHQTARRGGARFTHLLLQLRREGSEVAELHRFGVLVGSLQSLACGHFTELCLRSILKIPICHPKAHTSMDPVLEVPPVKDQLAALKDQLTVKDATIAQLRRIGTGRFACCTLC